MSHILTDIGEEYVVKNGFDAVTVQVGVYNDGADGTGDTVGDTTDLPLSTEPSNTNYGRQDAAMTAADIGGNWGADNDGQLTFDFSDLTTTHNVDSWFIAVTFESTDAGDAAGSPAAHLVATGPLQQSRDLGSIDTLNLSAGDGSGNGVGVTVD